MKKIVLFIFSMMIIVSVSYSQQKKGESWSIPDKYKALKSPVLNDNLVKTTGKVLWSKHCKSCHGNLGLGDGVRSASLKTFPGNFKEASFQSQSDGMVYYQSFIGRGEMPNFESKIPDEEDRWLIVKYIRTMK